MCRLLCVQECFQIFQIVVMDGSLGCSCMLSFDTVSEDTDTCVDGIRYMQTFFPSDNKTYATRMLSVISSLRN